ncbi:hypothetical protein ASF73_21085 [Xanthomonas sp. Leaf131]|nr:hypothetical protein ASF73_21085 [Xanthomonas sp. Leaf131]
MSTAQITWLGFASLLAISILYTGRLAYSTLAPPKYNPPIFVLSGVVLIGVALAFSHMTAVAIIEGIIDFQSRQFGHLFASRNLDAMEFWLLVTIQYGFGLLFASYGTAGIALCWSKRADGS